jgi:2-oxoglutarate ferredoxin oxidoreductase subunit alpha
MGVPVSPAQHLPVQHPGPADLVRSARHRARLSRPPRRRGHDGGDESADLGPGRPEIDPGGYLFYDSSKPLPRAKFRDDIHVLGMPLTEICNATYSDARQRQLFKNIIYVGALTALLDIDPAEIEKLFGEQYKGKEKLLDSNVQALKLGRDYARAAPQADRAQGRAPRRVGDRIFVDGNSAAALGCVYGGATVCAWYPITPSSSVAEAFSATRRSCASTRNRQRIATRSSRPRTNWPRSAWSSAPAGTARAPSPPPPVPASR